MVNDEDSVEVKSHNQCWRCSARCLTSEFIRIRRKVTVLIQLSGRLSEHYDYRARALANNPFGAQHLPDARGDMHNYQSTTRVLYPLHYACRDWTQRREGHTKSFRGSRLCTFVQRCRQQCTNTRGHRCPARAARHHFADVIFHTRGHRCPAPAATRFLLTSSTASQHKSTHAILQIRLHTHTCSFTSQIRHHGKTHAVPV